MGITLWDHFRHLRQKYISATSAHQVNIRSALYKHYTKIKSEDCELSLLDISDVFHDPLHQNDADDISDDVEEEEEESLQPGSPPPNKPNKKKKNAKYQIEMSDMSDIGSP